MLCEVCQSEEAVVTLIPIAEGMPQSIGPGCFARFGLESAKAVLPAEEIAGILGPLFVAPARAEALAKTPKRRGAPPEAAEPEPEPRPETTAAPVEEPAAAADA